ncbi:hypothetical protein [Lactobacillus acetotolerans]|uniref:hypothetical protein n=1 Tax=Lactobacillus acetotolerans TaxID=1600 RepID=UPI002FD94286
MKDFKDTLVSSMVLDASTGEYTVCTGDLQAKFKIVGGGFKVTETNCLYHTADYLPIKGYRRHFSGNCEGLYTNNWGGPVKFAEALLRARVDDFLSIAK